MQRLFDREGRRQELIDLIHKHADPIMDDARDISVTVSQAARRAEATVELVAIMAAAALALAALAIVVARARA